MNPQPQWHHISSRFATQAVAHEPWLQWKGGRVKACAVAKVGV